MLSKSLDAYIFKKNLSEHSNKTTEYKEITKHKNKNNTYITASQKDNVPKNRYYNILANDNTRVKLVGLNNNYINANHITFTTKNTTSKYISTQAPVPYSFRDFWKMVWDQKSSTIIMLTKIREKNKYKAHQYWKNKNTLQFKYSKTETTNNCSFTLSVSLIKKIKLDNGIIIRNFILKSGSTSRYINHIQYCNWGDYKCPSSIQDITTLIRLMELFQESGQLVKLNGPPIVHCSAGVGRSGIFIACSIVKNLLLYELPVNICDIVTQMRLCRTGMVQTDEQYSFIYQFKESITI
jgi:protein tyrosine phosphatase